MKIALGTAQFNCKYGILNKGMYEHSIKKVLEDISDKISIIDTAPSYYNAEIMIGKYLKKKKKIVTKINPFKFNNIRKNIDLFKNDFEKSLKNMNTESIYGILFHNPKNILSKNITSFIKILDDLKNQNIIKKIGYSEYNFENIEKYQKIYNFNLIQLPINIFNTNINQINKLLNLKKKYNLEIHARSIFLQGLGLCSINKVKKKFNKLKKKLEIFNNFTKNTGISNYDFLLSSVYNIKQIDACLIGISSKEHYDHLLNFKPIKNIYINNNFYIKDKKITDPRYW
jgi:aryl-alcohol dehydrogenase-like predicted oxidoreductase